MATEASLAGIQKYGLGWKASIQIVGIQERIGEVIDDAETNEEALKAAHEKACRLIYWLIKAYSSRIPEESKAELCNIIQNLWEVFVEGSTPEEDLAMFGRDYHKLNTAIIQARGNDYIGGMSESLDEEDMEEMVDGLADELVGQINTLFDWADYYRICING